MKALLVLILAFATVHSGEEETSISNSLACDVCKVAVPELEKKLEEKPTVDSIERLLDSVCEKIPKMQSQCKDIVTDYLPAVLNTISHLPAGNFCSDIHLCPPSQTLQKPLLKLPTVNPTLCLTCIAVCDGIETLMTSGSIAANITHFISQVCDILPKVATCKSILQLYLPRLIKELNSFTPRQYCAFFGLCEPQSFKFK